MCAWNEKKYCSCIVLIRIDIILSKNISINFQSLLFKKLHAQSGNQTDIFWKFYLPADTLWLPKTIGRVLGYTTGSKFIKITSELCHWIDCTKATIVLLGNTPIAQTALCQNTNMILFLHLRTIYVFHLSQRIKTWIAVTGKMSVMLVI